MILKMLKYQYILSASGNIILLKTVHTNKFSKYFEFQLKQPPWILFFNYYYNCLVSATISGIHFPCRGNITSFPVAEYHSVSVQLLIVIPPDCTLP